MASYAASLYLFYLWAFKLVLLSVSQFHKLILLYIWTCYAINRATLFTAFYPPSSVISKYSAVNKSKNILEIKSVISGQHSGGFQSIFWKLSNQIVPWRVRSVSAARNNKTLVQRQKKICLMMYVCVRISLKNLLKKSYKKSSLHQSFDM